MNFINNYHQDTRFSATESCSYFSSGNIGTFSGGKKQNNAYEVIPVKTSSAQDAKNDILLKGGASLPVKDQVDLRIIKLIQNGKDSIINSQTEVGGWPKLETVKADLDSDKDGMPDEWEKAYKLDHLKPGNNEDSDGDGFTDLEEFLNKTNPLDGK